MSHPPFGSRIYKEYVVIDPTLYPNHRCKAGDVSSYEGRCRSKYIVFMVEVITKTLKDKTIHSRIGFCQKHIPTKYRRWFWLGLGFGTKG